MSRNDWLLERKKEKGCWLWSNSKEVAKLKAHKIWKYTNKHFFHETTLEFQAQCRYPSKKWRHFVLGHNSQHQVSVFMLFLLVLGKSIILYSLLSLKIAGVTTVVCTQLYISGTILYQYPGTGSCAPGMDSPYNIQHTLVRVLHCCFIAKVRVPIPASVNCFGAFFSQPHELWRISLDGSCILTFNCFINTHSKYFKFITGYLDSL